jgi:hypothetical protein
MVGIGATGGPGASGTFGASLRFRPTVSSSLGAAGGGAPKLALATFAGRVRDLGDALRDLRLAGRHTDSAGRGRAAAAVSRHALGLDLTPSPAELRSSEEVNTVATSYATHAPGWTGASTAAASIDGVYDGAQGDSTLTFTVTSGGDIGVDDVSLEVTDGGGQPVESIVVTAAQGSGATVLSNGLELAFGSGTLQAGDTFELDVSASVGSAVDPDAAFDGTGDDAPGFEPGVVVDAGAFWVNGQRITVGASDSIESILSSINGSAAGVTATFDDLEERVVLTQNTPGSLETIEVTGDTSGFVAAVKLDDAELEFGTRNDIEEDIDEVAGITGLTSGTFAINGVEFTVDVAEDSLGDMIRWINSSEAGVLAYFDETSGYFSVRAKGSGSVVLDDGTSGFFTALDVVEGTYRGERNGRDVSFRDRSALHRELRELSEALAPVFQGEVGGYGVGAAKVIRSALTKELEATFETFLGREGDERLRSGLGIDLGESKNGVRSLEIDGGALARALKRDEEELRDLLFSEQREDGRSGLLERLEKALESAYGQLAGMLSPEESLGLRLDVVG